MDYKKVLTQVVEQGAIRIYSSSNAWHVAYRIKDGQMQARNLNKMGEHEWRLGTTLAGGSSADSEDGWQTVHEVHFGVQPIELAAARQNAGYYHGLTQRCETCKQEKSGAAFSRDMTFEEGRRAWECDDCAEERQGEVQANNAVRAGDVIRRETHASVPPIKSEI